MRPPPGGPAARRRSRGGFRRAAAAVPAALLLVGCGIQQSDVVDAGSPATLLVRPGVSDGMLLFFRSGDGRLVPVPRATPVSRGASRDTPVERALDLLLAGPQPQETAAGIGTSLPASARVVQVVFRPQETRVGLSVALDELDATALDQLICTAAYAVQGREDSTVVLSGRGGGTKTGTCDAQRSTVSPPSTATRHASPDTQGTSAGRVSRQDPVTERTDR
ncbi:hypothetical protein AB0D30_31190 [Streptomyces sp. NPDC048409]|uniref:GerMN domain-containing protein n=1 Tax=Streptomyces sp. NPDC048409 TaxID=3154723 RepID=UPI00344875FC